VIADDTPEKSLTLKNGNLSDAARQAFRLLHSGHEPGDATDDEIFGTTEPPPHS